MNEIIVTSQEQLDSIPIDYNGRILIKFGTPYNRAVVRKRFKYPVEAWGNSSVVAWGNSSVEALGNSSVVALENSSVVARGNSYVVAWENSSVVAWGNSSVEAWENSSVVAWGNSSVVARGNSSVEAWENSSVVAWGNVQIVQKSGCVSTALNGNSRIVHDPDTIDEYIDSVGDLYHDDLTVRLYKAVHKKNGRYFSDYDRHTEYMIGSVTVADYITSNQENDCGHGIHMADKSWCVAHGNGWDDLAILEVEAIKSEIVVPRHGVCKVRSPRVRVIREVPLSECGLLGEMIERRRRTHEQ